MIARRKKLGLTQDKVNYKLGVADRLVSKWECGVRTLTAFNLHCWADVLEGFIVFGTNPKPIIPHSIVKKKVVNGNYVKIRVGNNTKINFLGRTYLE